MTETGGLLLVAAVLVAAWLITRNRTKETAEGNDAGEQEGRPAEGYQMITEPRAQITDHFNAWEFRCRCNRCTGFKIARMLVVLLEAMRAGIGRLIPGAVFVVNSGYRCPDHNAAQGGAPRSLHLAGQAADISTPSKMDRAHFHRFAYSYWYLSKRGGLGLYDWGVHLDLGPVRLWDRRSVKAPLA